jgi:Domain of unknown function (DUF4375)
LDQKKSRNGEEGLSTEERAIVAIDALEREVNNGGYRQFFENFSREYAPIIVLSLQRIGCVRTAEITQRAIDALHLPTLTVDTIEAAIDSAGIDEQLNRCDKSYCCGGEDIAGKLFAFIKTNKSAIVHRSSSWETVEIRDHARLDLFNLDSTPALRFSLAQFASAATPVGD